MLRWATERPGGFGPGLEELPSDGSAPIVLILSPSRELGRRARPYLRRGGQTRGSAPADAVRRTDAPEPGGACTIHEPALGDVKNVWLVELPREYASFARLMLAAKLVISDSGSAGGGAGARNAGARRARYD